MVASFGIGGGPLKDPARFRVPRSQYGAMTQMLRLRARDRHCFAFRGHVRCRAVKRVIVELHRKHGVMASSQEYYTRRRLAGQPSGRLVLAPGVTVRGNGEPGVEFALMSETMLPAEPGMRHIQLAGAASAGSPLVWAQRYQLALRSSGQVTWRLTDAEFKRRADEIEAAVLSGRVEQVHGVLRPLTKLPLFHGVSADCYRLIRIARSRWAHRTRRRAGPSSAPGLDVSEYMERCRPRRGVGGVVYARSNGDDKETVRTVADLLRQCAEYASESDPEDS